MSALQPFSPATTNGSPDFDASPATSWESVAFLPEDIVDYGIGD